MEARDTLGLCLGARVGGRRCAGLGQPLHRAQPWKDWRGPAPAASYNRRGRVAPLVIPTPPASDLHP